MGGLFIQRKLRESYKSSHDLRMMNECLHFFIDQLLDQKWNYQVEGAPQNVSIVDSQLALVFMEGKERPKKEEDYSRLVGARFNMQGN